jgi:serine/threonine protein phosphatase PrpC
MKKIALVLLMVGLCFQSRAFAMSFEIFDMRNKIFDESKEIKSLMGSSRDVILLTVMFDSCFLTMSQLDAYFVMLGIFDTIGEKAASEKALNLLSNWLNEMRRNTTLNISAMDAMPAPMETSSRSHVAKLRGYFAELNNRIDAELEKVSTIKKAALLSGKK